MSKNDELVPPEYHAPQPPAAPEPGRAVPPAMLWTFWGAVAAAVIAARVLDAMLPNTPEHVIERWIMVAFGAFLVGFLLKLK